MKEKEKDEKKKRKRKKSSPKNSVTKLFRWPKLA